VQALEIILIQTACLYKTMFGDFTLFQKLHFGKLGKKLISCKKIIFFYFDCNSHYRW